MKKSVYSKKKILCLNGYNPTSLDEIKFEKYYFKGGEPHIVIEDPLQLEELYISLRFKVTGELIELLLAVDAIKRINSDLKLNLIIPYFPGARQDRIMNEGEPLTVKVIANLVNSLGFSKVVVVDPHSNVTEALINNIVVVDNSELVKEVIGYLNKDLYLVSPDAGSNKKIHNLSKKVNIDKIILCDKHRDVKTNDILSYNINSTFPEGVDCLIVDDICDGGRTFISLAKTLKERGANKVYLVVTHGIFSYGLSNIVKDIDHVFCWDTYENNVDSVLLTQFKFTFLNVEKSKNY